MTTIQFATHPAWMSVVQTVLLFATLGVVLVVSAKPSMVRLLVGLGVAAGCAAILIDLSGYCAFNPALFWCW